MVLALERVLLHISFDNRRMLLLYCILCFRYVSSLLFYLLRV